MTARGVAIWVDEGRGGGESVRWRGGIGEDVRRKVILQRLGSFQEAIHRERRGEEEKAAADQISGHRERH